MHAPAGQHTAWAYRYVPHSATVDMAVGFEASITRLAPDFLDRMLARSVMSSAAIEPYNANDIGRYALCFTRRGPYDPR